MFGMGTRGSPPPSPPDELWSEDVCRTLKTGIRDIQLHGSV